VSKVVKSRLGESALELCWVGEKVEDARREVTSQTRSALSLTNVDLEIGACERTILNATSSRTTKGTEAKDVLSRSKFDIFAVATKARCG
jgi:hypothetical protein